MKRLDTSVVIAIPFATHAAYHAVRSQPLLVIVRCILAAAIGMVQYILFGSLKLISLIQRFQNKRFGHSFVHVKTNDLTGAQILYASQIEPAFICRDIRDVGHPDFVWLLRRKLLVQHIVSYRQFVFRVRRCLVFLHCARFQSKFFHDTGNGFLRNVNTLLLQDLPHFRTSVEPSGIDEDSANLLLQLLSTLAAMTLLSLDPFVITASGYLENGAHLRDTELEAVIVDEFVDQRRSFAK